MDTSQTTNNQSGQSDMELLVGIVTGIDQMLKDQASLLKQFSTIVQQTISLRQSGKFYVIDEIVESERKDEGDVIAAITRILQKATQPMSCTAITVALQALNIIPPQILNGKTYTKRKLDAAEKLGILAYKEVRINGCEVNGYLLV